PGRARPGCRRRPLRSGSPLGEAPRVVGRCRRRPGGPLRRSARSGKERRARGRGVPRHAAGVRWRAPLRGRRRRPAGRCAGARAPRWRPSTGRVWSGASSSSCWGMPVERRTNVPNNVLWVVLGLCLTFAAVIVARKLVAFLSTLRARALTPVLLRRLSRWVRTHHYSDAQFFQADGAGELLVSRRREGIERLGAFLRAQYPES